MLFYKLSDSPDKPFLSNYAWLREVIMTDVIVTSFFNCFIKPFMLGDLNKTFSNQMSSALDTFIDILCFG